jgi:hypothetical protein
VSVGPVSRPPAVFGDCYSSRELWTSEVLLIPARMLPGNNKFNFM